MALELGIPCGGWCPKGRLAEDGPIPGRYLLAETKSKKYIERTRLNVRDSDGTLILTAAPPSGGTADAIAFAEKTGRPLLVIDPMDAGVVARARAWLAERRVRVLNLAGPRESERPGMYDAARKFLLKLLG